MRARNESEKKRGSLDDMVRRYIHILITFLMSAEIDQSRDQSSNQLS